LREIARDKRYWENKRSRIRKSEKRLDEVLTGYQEELEKIKKEKNEILNKARKEAEDLLQGVNRKIENTIRIIRETQAEKEKTKQAREELAALSKKIEVKQKEEDRRLDRKIEQLKRKEMNRQKRTREKIQPEVASNLQEKDKPVGVGDKVKMKGQDDSDPTAISHDNDSYTSKKPWQRIIILLAGPFANFLTAFFLYLAISYIGVPKLLAFVGEVTPDAPAQMAGVQIDDKILQINGVNIQYWEEVGKAINSSDKANLTLVVEGKNQLVTLQLEPKVIEDKNMRVKRARSAALRNLAKYHSKSISFFLEERLNIPQALDHWSELQIDGLLDNIF